MSSEATHFVRRHVRGITLVERAVLLTIADRCGANGTTPRGRGPSHATLAGELEMSERTVRRWVDSLVEKKELVVPGRCTFEIPGVEEHDPDVCGNADCLKANRSDMAGKHSRASTRSGQIWPKNRSDMAAKTFSPSERDRAGDAQGSAPRSGGVALCPSFADDGSGHCTHCGLPKANQRHRSKP